MGDRGNIYLIDEDPEHGIYLYTHWSGSEWPEELRKALEVGRPRWMDSPYLARIITLEVFKDLLGQETGGGISTMLCDNEHPIVICDLRNRIVAFSAPDSVSDSNSWTDSLSFADYVAAGPRNFEDES